MKVIYEYDEETKSMIKGIDDAIDSYLEEYEKKIRMETFHINPTPKYIKECVEYDPQYNSLLNLRKNIYNRSIPKIVIIETDDKTMEFPITK